MPETKVSTHHACCGVRRGNTHMAYCTQRCWDCSGDIDGPRRCRCRDAAPSPLALQIQDRLRTKHGCDARAEDVQLVLDAPEED